MGEEAYTIAILLSESLEDLQLKRDVKIFATNVDTKAIETASRDVFNESIIDKRLPRAPHPEFLNETINTRSIKKFGKMIIFAPHNAFQYPPFSKLDLISYRNVQTTFSRFCKKIYLKFSRW